MSNRITTVDFLNNTVAHYRELLVDVRGKIGNIEYHYLAEMDRLRLEEKNLEAAINELNESIEKLKEAN